MSIFDDIRTKGAAYRLTEEALYAEALREIESGQRRDGIWAKALAESDMDQGKAGAKYIKLRVQSLKDEVALAIDVLRRTEVECKIERSVEAAALQQASIQTMHNARLEQSAREKAAAKLALENRSPALKKADERQVGYFLIALGLACGNMIYFMGEFVSKLPISIGILLLVGGPGGVIGGLVHLIKSLRT